MYGDNSVADMNFHLFLKLPVELRVMIWHLSLPRTRIVSIQCSTTSLFEMNDSSWGTSPAIIPANLHTCRESRQEAMRYYNLRFGVAGPPKIFFNPQIDILHFGPAKGFMASSAQYFTAVSLCNPMDLGAVRYLAIDDSVLGNSTVKGAASNLAARAIRQLAMRMPELKGLVFVRNQATSITIKEAEDHCIELQRLIDSAMGEVSSEFPDWEAPPWCTAKMASGTNAARGRA
ncbi:hypothetical protein K456DRAFT_31705 [Colletotrichum gloeosporioides 23]|nr:hypothetical protein K456DRAFT_31705 [Colletotrichum gloeosporioides 23]